MALVAAGGDVEAAVGRGRDAAGPAGEHGLRGGALVADVALDRRAAAAAAGERGDRAVERDAPHAAVVGEQHATVGSDVDREGPRDRGVGGRAAVAVAVLRGAAAGDRGDRAAGVDTADAVRLGDQQLAALAERDAGAALEPRLRGEAAIADAVVGRAAARHGRHQAVGADLADDAVVDRADAAEHVLGDVDAAVRRDGDVARVVEHRARRRDALTGRGPAARERVHDAVRRDPLHAPLRALGDIHGAVVGDAEADRAAEAGRQRAHVPVGIDLAHGADEAAAVRLRHLGEVDGAVGPDLGLVRLAERRVRAVLAVALARERRGVAVAGRRRDDRVGVDVAAASQVDGVRARVVEVVDVERPAAETLGAGVEAAEHGLDVVAVLAPDDQVHAVAHALDLIPGGAEPPERVDDALGLGVRHEAVLVADLHRRRRGADDVAAVGVLAVPDELALEAGARVVGLLEVPSGDVDGEEHLLQPARHLGRDQRRVERVLILVAGRAVAPVAQVVRRAGERDALAEPLALAADDRAEADALLLRLELVRLVLVGDRDRRRDGVRRRRERPVAVPRREVRDRDAPQALARVVEVGQARALVVGDAQRRAVVGGAVAVDVDVGTAVGLADDLHDAAVLGRLPAAVLAIVVADRDDAADREVEEVVDVGDDRLVEAHVGGAGLDRLVDAELDRVGVAGGGRQGARHGGAAGVADRVLGRAHVELVESPAWSRP